MTESQEEKQMDPNEFNNSIGAKRIRVKFDSGNNNVVQNLKESFARSINRVEKLRDLAKELPKEEVGELHRLVNCAQTAIEEASVWATKAATFNK